MDATSIKIFYSHSGSPQDRKLRQELEKHLSLTKRQLGIDEWHNGMLVAGDEKDRVIMARLTSANLILLLISADFLDSSQCDLETQIALRRHDAGEAITIPILIRSVDWEDAAFNKLEVLPENHKSVQEHKNQAVAFTGIVKKIRAAISKVAQVSRATTAARVPLKAAISKETLHLCDRTLQQYQLQLALRKNERAHRPLISIIHGASDECLVEFKDRLKRTTLPAFLGSDFALEEYHLEPPQASISRADAFFVLEQNIAGLFAERHTSLNDVAAMLSKNPARTLIFSHLFSQNWDSETLKQLDILRK